MAIHVTCPGCFARFSVSEKFGGREGPCPKCKAVIKIPEKNEEIVIYTPEDAGPKDRSGRPVLRPIKRRENEMTPVLLTIIIAVSLAMVVLAISVRIMSSDKSAIGWWWMGLGGWMVAVPIAIAGYGFLRDPELGQFVGREFWLRAVICSICYALTWGAFPLMEFTFASSGDLTSWISAAVLMVVAGSIVAMGTWEFDFIPASLHFAFFLGCCLVLRWIAGVGILPGMLTPADDRTVSEWVPALSWIASLWL